MNSKEFSLKIESIVKQKRIPHMDAVLDFCKDNEIDPATIGSLISKSLKEKIKVEALNLKLLKNIVDTKKFFIFLIWKFSCSICSNNFFVT